MLQNLKINLFAGAGLGVVPEKMTEEGKHISNPLIFPEHETADHNRESPAQLENPIRPRVYIKSIAHSTMYEKAPFY